VSCDVGGRSFDAMQVFFGGGVCRGHATSS
jgi:hypothetical protein